MRNGLSSIENAIKSLQQGGMVILVDDEGRENEGDLVAAAEHATPEVINFMSTYARGLICLPLTSADFRRLALPLMTQNNRSRHHTAFGVSIEAADGIDTGISAADRARTIQVAINSHSGPSDIVMPGHMFPLQAKDGGVLVRPGHTEGSIDLARLAGCKPAAVICEIMNPDGTMARLPDLKAFAKQHHLPIVSIRDLIRYRLRNEHLVDLEAQAQLPINQAGEFTIQTFKSNFLITDSIALIKQNSSISSQPCLVRMHSECVTGDLFASLRCDCGNQLKQSLSLIGKQGGILLYLRQEGRGIGLVNKIKAYALQEKGLDTVEANQELGFEADQRDYGLAAQMLKAMGIRKVRLLTNNPRKVFGLLDYGIDVCERLPLETSPHDNNIHYLKTKKEKLGHWLQLKDLNCSFANS